MPPPTFIITPLLIEYIDMILLCLKKKLRFFVFRKSYSVIDQSIAAVDFYCSDIKRDSSTVADAFDEYNNTITYANILLL